MRHRYTFLASLLILSRLFGADAAPERNLVDNLRKVSLAFEKNHGQAAPAADFLARGAGYAVWLSHGDAHISLRRDKDATPANVELNLAGARRDPKAEGRNALPGKVNYVVYGHDNVAGADAIAKRSFELTNVSADAERCHIGYHWRFDNGKPTNNIIDRDDELFLKNVRDVAVTPMDQEINQANAKLGHPEQNAKVDPPIFLVVVVRTNGHSMRFNFYDETLADRVSKALEHAVQLCGGGNQEPF